MTASRGGGRELDLQQQALRRVVQVEIEEFVGATKPLPQRVLMDVDRRARGCHIAEVAEVGEQGGGERGAVVAVVPGDPLSDAGAQQRVATDRVEQAFADEFDAQPVRRVVPGAASVARR